MNAATILSLAALAWVMVRFITLMSYIASSQRKVDERLRRYAKR